jgi:hypothetical protein
VSVDFGLKPVPLTFRLMERPGEMFGGSIEIILGVELSTDPAGGAVTAGAAAVSFFTDAS